MKNIQKVKKIITNILVYFLVYFLVFIISLNVGRLLAYLILEFIMWLGILPYLEKFFGWFIL